MLTIPRLLGTRILEKRCAYSTDAKNLRLETKAGRMSFSLPFKYISAEVVIAASMEMSGRYLLVQNMDEVCVIDILNELSNWQKS